MFIFDCMVYVHINYQCLLLQKKRIEFPMKIICVKLHDDVSKANEKNCKVTKNGKYVDFSSIEKIAWKICENLWYNRISNQSYHIVIECTLNANYTSKYIYEKAFLSCLPFIYSQIVYIISSHYIYFSQICDFEELALEFIVLLSLMERFHIFQARNQLGKF